VLTRCSRFVEICWKNSANVVTWTPLPTAALANRGCERIPLSQASLQVDTPTRRLASKLLGLLSQP
jgi:hypothetical protein